MRKKTALLAILPSLALAALPVQAATDQGYAETSKEAVQLYVNAVCAGDKDEVVRQISRLDQVGTPAFDIWLERNSEECQRYGGIASVEFEESGVKDITRENHDVIYRFGDGSTSAKQRLYTEQQNGIYRVKTDDTHICDEEGCFE